MLFNQIEAKVRSELRRVNRSSWYDEVMAIMAVFYPYGAASPHRYSLFVTGEDEGVGLTFVNDNRRELDLDYIDGSWTFLKTTDSKLLKGPRTIEEIEAICTEGIVESDDMLKELAQWFFNE